MDDMTTVQVPGLNEDQALERIVAFIQRFEYSHADLAAHAAFPLVLTPDLLYRIWASFLPQIPWTTVADILLSPLCREVGYELYEMDPAIRNILLRELRKDYRFGEARLRELAGFLEGYIKLNWESEDPDQRNLAEAQHLTALANTAPDQAAREIAAKLSDLAQLEGSELLRVATLTESLAAQLQGYSPLVGYARGVERLAHGDRQTASDLLNRVFEGEEDIEIAGVTLQRPRPVPDVRQAKVEEETVPPVTEAAVAPGAQDVAVDRQVYISYAWGGESEEVVGQIDRALQQRDIKIIRDKRDLGDQGSISEFLGRSGRGNCVVVVISDKYLRSSNCMFELIEIAENKQFYDHIFPVVLKDADIYDPVKRIEYVKYWEVKRTELAEAMKTMDPANLQGIREDLDLYDRIRDRVSGLTGTLEDMHALTPDMYRDSDFSELYAAIEKRLREEGAEERERRGEGLKDTEVRQARRKSSAEAAPGIDSSQSQRAMELVQRLGREFQVDVQAVGGGSEGQFGAWTLAELERLYQTIALVAKLMGGNKAFIRNLSGLSVQKADIGAHGGEAYAHRINFSTRGTFSAWTTVHEIAHAWDANYGWQLSRLLEKYTGGSTNRLRSVSARLLGNWDAGLNGPENKPGRHGRLPGCNAAGYFYGDKPSGSNWNFNRVEDFAESVGMYIGWERGNELSGWAKARIDRYLLEDGVRHKDFGIDNWKFYRRYFYPEGGDYAKTRRWQFIDDLIKGNISLSDSK